MLNFIDDLVTGFKIGREKGKIIKSALLEYTFDKEYSIYSGKKTVKSADYYLMKSKDKIEKLEETKGKVQKFAEFIGYCLTSKHYDSEDSLGDHFDIIDKFKEKYLSNSNAS